jgi:dephospho-CoA kinase
VEYLVQQKGFVHFSVRNLLTEEIIRRGYPVTRENMYHVANEFRKISPGYIVETLLQNAQESEKNCVIESLRSIGEIETLRTHPQAVLFAVDAEPNIRYQRILQRGSITDHVTFETFIEEERRESQSDDPNQGNLPKCIKQADYKFENNGSVNELFAKVEEVLENL